MPPQATAEDVICLMSIVNKGLLHILNNYEKEIRHQKRNNKSR